MQMTVAGWCIDFITRLISYGRESGLLNSIHLYNNFFKANSEEYKGLNLGM